MIFLINKMKIYNKILNCCKICDSSKTFTGNTGKSYITLFEIICYYFNWSTYWETKNAQNTATKPKTMNTRTKDRSVVSDKKSIFCYNRVCNFIEKMLY